jgi:hypothetical protein
MTQAQRFNLARKIAWSNEVRAAKWNTGGAAAGCSGSQLQINCSINCLEMASSHRPSRSSISQRPQHLRRQSSVSIDISRPLGPDHGGAHPRPEHHVPVEHLSIAPDISPAYAPFSLACFQGTFLFRSNFFSMIIFFVSFTPRCKSLLTCRLHE